MSKKVNRKVPKLRFSEFEGDWQISTIEKIASVSSGGTPSRTEASYWDGDIPWVTTGEISQFEIFDTIEKITQKGLENSSAKIFNKNTLLMAMYGQGKTRGQIAILRIDATTNQACAAITLKKSYSPEFYYYFLFREYEHLRTLSNEGSQKNLSAGLIKEYKVPIIPIAEQEKIASFFWAVDTRISQLRRKHELLQTYKRGVMQKVFCRKLGKKKHKKKPELRLKKFVGDWKQVLVGSFIEAQNTIGSEDIPLYSLTIENGITEKTERYERQFLVKNEDEAYKLVRPNDFAYNPMNLRFGAIARHKKHISVKVSKYYDVFSIRSNVNLTFAEYLLRNEDSIQYYDSLASGSLIEKKRLHFSEFKKISFLMPSLEEQEKIADFLIAIDQKIEAVAKQIELTEQFKKGLLQKMFV